MWEYILDNLIFFIIVVVCVIACIVVLVLLSVMDKDESDKQPEKTANEPMIFAPATPKAAEPVEAEQTQQAEAIEEGKETPEQPKRKYVPANRTAAAPAQEPVRAPYSGKWVITCIDGLDPNLDIVEQTFFFQLKASNGEPLLSSEDYTSLRGATAGIETFKSNIMAENFKIATTKKGTHVVKLLNGQGMLLAQGEPYSSLTAARTAVSSIKRFAQTAVIAEEMQRFGVPFEPDAYYPETDYDPSKKGKWTIRSVTNSIGRSGFFFELRASNGQILFTSEDYTSLSGVKDGIITHRNNIANGNIRPRITRNGDYIVKIYTSDGRLLALGDHYATKALCQSAIASIVRFAYTADVDETYVSND